MDASPGNVEGFRLSPQQRHLWMLHQEWGGSAFRSRCSLRIRGPLDVATLGQALRRVVERHEILRTTFQLPRGATIPLQVIEDAGEIRIAEHDLRELDPTELHTDLDALYRGDGGPAAALDRGPLLEAALAAVGPEDHTLMLSIPALCADARSVEILAAEVASAYALLSRNAPLSGEPLQFADLAEWQIELLEDEATESGRAFWRDLSRVLPPVRWLPFRRDVGDRAEFEPGYEGVELDPRWCAELGVSTEIALLTLWGILIWRMSGQTEIVVGTAFDGRRFEELQGALGPFTRHLPVRFRLDTRHDVQTTLRAIGEQVAEFRERQEYYDGNAGGPEGSDPVYGFELVENPAISDAGSVSFAIERLRACSERFEIELSCVRQQGEGIEVGLHYDPMVYAAEDVRELGRCLGALARDAADHPDRRIGELELLGDEQRHRLLVDFNATKTDADEADLAHRMFERCAGRAPDVVALVFGDGHLTYGQLDARANRLARHLATLGVGPDVPVGLCVERSPEMVTALLAILKAGGAYVPLDPSYPDERLAFVIADAAMPVIVTQERFAGRLSANGVAVLRVDADRSSFEGNSARPPAVTLTPENLCYAIYTSGSTGRPKGVMIPHGGLANYLRWATRAYRVDAGEGTVMHSQLGFDLTVTSLLAPLVIGQRVALLPEALPFEELGAALGRFRGSSLLKITPAHLEVLRRQLGPDDIASLTRVLVLGGEALQTEAITSWCKHAPGMRVVNEYGPTETVVGCCVHEVDAVGQKTGAIPIGHPIANTRLFVVSPGFTAVPRGVVGELCVGGAQLARGYFGSPDLTADKFVPDPFGEPGSRLYRTGDLARHLRDGGLEFLGRIDDQVKLRGYRIELGEIEATLASHPEVREAVVVLREEPSGAKRLAAYLTTAGDSGPAVGALHAFLNESLPEYMVPGVFVVLDELPLTANGKVDRRALPAPDRLRVDSQREPSPPRTEAERILARICAEVLGCERVDTRDNFFELGGDSILSLRVVARAAQEGLRLTPRQVFDHPTIAELAVLAGSEATTAVDRDTPAGPFPITPIQHWFFSQEIPDPHHFNQAVVLELVRSLDLQALERAFRVLIQHHDALRLRFCRTESGWMQEVAATVAPAEVTLVDLSRLPPTARAAAFDAAAAELQASLDLTQGPLLRLALLDCGEGTRLRLIVVIHHLAVDGVSWRVLLEDIGTAYRDAARGREVSLPTVATSLACWARMLSEHATSPELEEEAAYWLAGERAGASPLPVEHPGGENTVALARKVTVSLDVEETVALLEDVPGIYHTRIDDVLLTALVEAFASWTGERVLLVDLEGHGRDATFDGVDLSRTVGWFTALFPVLLDITDAELPGDSIKLVKEQLRAVPNRGIGYGLMRYCRTPERADPLQTLPEAEVSFNYLGRLDAVLPDDSPFEVSRQPSGPLRSAAGRRCHLVDVHGFVAGGRLEMVWTYSENVHTEANIERLAHAYLAALRELIHHCRSPGAGGFTPSDFPLARLAPRQLDGLLASHPQAEDIYALSPLQEGLLFHAVADAGSGVYVEQFSCTIDGDLDAAALRRAWQRVVDRHSILRTAFRWQGLDRPVQIVERAVSLPWTEEDWRGRPESERAAALDEFLRADCIEGFDPARAPLMRVAVLRCGAQSHHFVWTHHHLLMDGWSMSLLWKEVLALYQSFARGEELELEGPNPYRGYIDWLARRDLAEAEAFWRCALNGFAEPTTFNFAPPTRADLESATPTDSRTIRLSASKTALLQSFARHSRLTMNTLVNGAWALLSSRCSGQRDVVFGATVAGRPGELPGVDTMMGPFINTIPVRVRVSADRRLLEWLHDLQDQQQRAREHEFYPLVEIQKCSDVAAGRPLFDTILVFENYPIDESVRDPAVDWVIRDTRTVDRVNYPLAVLVVPSTELLLRIDYDASRFGGATIERLLSQLETLLEEFVAAPDRRLSEFSMVDDDERRQVLVEWNDTAADYSADLCIHQLFEAHAERAPDAVAVVSGDQSVTYGTLNGRANQLARRLRALGVGPETAVGIFLERTADALVSVLGALKSGAAYVPLDPSYPPVRLRFILEDAAVAVLLTSQDLADRVPDCPARVLCLDAEWDVISRYPSDNVSSLAVPESLAYVIYTSGSTGTPRGVMCRHRSVVSYIEGVIRLFSMESGDRMLQFAPLSFDTSVEEIFSCLASGATLVLKTDAMTGSVREFVSACRDLEVTVLDLPAAYWHLVTSALATDDLSLGPPLRLVLIGGERASPDALAEWRRRVGQHPRLLNGYGPTEVTVVATFGDLSAPSEAEASAREVSIGRPVRNVRVYLLDPDGQPVPVGVPGAIHVAGAGLARGYVRRPDTTAACFVPDPFSGEPGARAYRTGDLGRHLADGNLEFLGRADEQVKIRGFRVELSEVEGALLEHPSVREAVVSSREAAPGKRTLVAYVIPVGAVEPTIGALRDHMAERVPDYMVPSAFVMLDELPLTPSGKVDRRALARIPAEPQSAHAPSTAPGTPHQEILAGLWSDALGIERVGVHDDFFEFGGDSLLAMRIASRIRETLGVELPIRALFENPTIDELARVLEVDRGERGEVAPLRRIDRAGELPVSFAQQRLWFLDQMHPGSSHYNVHAGLRVRGRLSVSAVERSLHEIVARHEVLRSTFATRADRPVQVVGPPLAVRLDVVDLRSIDGAQQVDTARVLGDAEARRPFDLSRGPLLRARLLRLGESDHVLLFTMHHIVSDGWSLGVLVREFSALYSAFGADRPSPLTDLPVQYADFAQWQRDWLRGEILERHLSYWKRRLGGERHELQLTTDRPRPAVESFRGANESLTLSAALTSRLRELSRREGVTVFMTFLAALKLLLHRYTGQDDVVVGADIGNRNRSELEGLIGCFVNILVMRTDLGGDPRFRELLGRVRETTLEAFAHQDLPFDRLVEELQPTRHVSRTPLFQVLLVFDNTPAATLSLPGLEVSSFENRSVTARFDLALFVSETDDGLVTSWSYKTDLFDESRVARLARHFETLLEGIVSSPDARLSKLKIQTEAEKGERAMKKKTRTRSEISKLRGARPRPIALSEIQVVHKGPLSDGQQTPLVVRPAIDDADLVEWARDSRDVLQAELLKHGAILFRGFRTSIPVFARFAEVLAPDLVRDYGDLPPEEDQDRIYHSTPYPADQSIEFHNESSHLDRWPRTQFFMCVQRPQERGETPIADCRQVYAALPPELRDKFASKGLLYVRNFMPKVDVDWREFFRTDDRAVVERRCRETGVELEWLEGDRLRTRNIALGVAKHPVTGEMAFFNQVQLHHVSCLPEEFRASARANFADEDLPRNVYFGDGTPIEDAEIEQVRDAFRQATVKFPWEDGDILMLENMLVAHGREPFVGPRKIVVAMGNMVRLQEL